MTAAWIAWEGGALPLLACGQFTPGYLNEEEGA